MSTSIDQRLNMTDKRLALEFISQVADDHMQDAVAMVVVTERPYGFLGCQGEPFKAFPKGVPVPPDVKYVFATVESKVAEFNLSPDHSRVCVTYYSRPWVGETGFVLQADKMNVLRTFGSLPQYELKERYSRLIDLRPVHLERLRDGGEPDSRAFYGAYSRSFKATSQSVTRFGSPEDATVQAVRQTLLREARNRKLKVFGIAIFLGLLTLGFVIANFFRLFGFFVSHLPPNHSVTVRDFLFARSLSNLVAGEVQKLRDWGEAQRQARILDAIARRVEWNARLESEFPTKPKPALAIVPKKGERREKVVPIRPEEAVQQEPKERSGNGGEIFHITLDGRIKELCGLKELSTLLPENISASVVRSILFSLMKPASQDGVWGVRYRKGDAFYNMVRHQYSRLEDGEQVQPKEISKALGWLLRQGVVLRFNKAEYTFSLQNKPGEGKNPQAQELIRHMLQWRDNFHN